MKHTAHLTSAVMTLCLAASLCNAAEPVPPVAKGVVNAPNSAPAVAPARVQAFAGVWDITKSHMNGPIPTADEIPLTPSYEVKRQLLETTDKSGKPVPGNNAKCIPNGMPNMMVFGFHVVADAEALTVIGGVGPSVRRIWLQRKQHTAPAKLFTSYTGESIAHWQGNTLVIDTRGIDRGNEITYGLSVADDNMHIIERWTLLSPTQLQVQLTIEDAAALRKPWTYTDTYGRRALDSEIHYCVTAIDREKDGGMDLTPPSGGYVPPGATE